MSTRFYFQNTVAPPAHIAPGFDSTWTAGAGSTDRRMCWTWKTGTAMATKNPVGTAANPEFICNRQYISEPLQTQTISGTIKGQIRCIESAIGKNATVAIGIRVLAEDGSIRGTLLSPAASDNTAATPPEMATSLTNRSFNDSAESASISLSSLDVKTGDRLIIEVGYRDAGTSTTQTAGSSFGDNSATDLPEDNTTTAANNPWVEFSQTLVFLLPQQIGNMDQVRSTMETVSATPRLGGIS